jgi:ribosomal protein S26
MSDKQISTQEQLAIEDVKRLANIVRSLRNDVFKQDLDYGVIPGTGTKPTLLLPGMEKLMRALHLRAEYVERSKLEDFDNGRIYYRYECRLIDYQTGYCVATAIGSANSMETKWRWREQKRVCPKCGKDTINRSKYPPRNAPEGTEPGWYCYAKIGGCGAEFSAIDPAIMNQQVGRVENPDIFDQMNTIDKIAQKRALSSAIKGAANVSEFFTVDLEDFQQYEMHTVVVTQDDGREVDTATGEITPPPAPVEPPPAAPAEAAVVSDDAKFDDIALATRSTRSWRLDLVTNHFVPKHVPDAAALNTLITRLESSGRIQDNNTVRQVIEAVNGELKTTDFKPPQNLGELKKLVIQELKLVKGGEVHWTRLLNRMREQGELTEAMELNQDYPAMFAAIQEHYADKPELKDAG